MLASVPKGEMKYLDIDPRSTFFREAEKKRSELLLPFNSWRKKTSTFRVL